MANSKISALTSATTPLAGTETLPVVQSSTTKKVTVADLTAGRAVSGASFAVTGSTAPANGIYLPASNTVGIAAGSTTGAYFDSSGRILMGTSAVINYGGLSTGVRTQVVQTDSTTNSVYPVAAFIRRTSGTPAAGIGARVDLCSDNAYSSVSEYASLVAIGTDLVNISGDLAIYTMLNNSSTEKWRFDSGGNLIQKVAAKGINFTANSSAAGKTSQLLNWYEEGTFTPTLIGTTTNPTVTYSIQRGRYTRVGRLVTIECYVAWSAFTGGSGNVAVSGFPYTIDPSTGASGGGAVSYFDGFTLTAARTSVGILANANTTYASPTCMGSGVTTQYIPVGSVAASGLIIFTLTYSV